MGRRGVGVVMSLSMDAPSDARSGIVARLLRRAHERLATRDSILKDTGLQFMMSNFQSVTTHVDEETLRSTVEVLECKLFPFEVHKMAQAMWRHVGTDVTDQPFDYKVRRSPSHCI